MGFGLLFLGYMFMYSFPTGSGIDILPDVIGFIISYFGVRTLADYGCGWDNMKKYYLAVIPSSLFTFILQIVNSFGKLDNISPYWNAFYTAILLVYNLFLLIAIYKIAEDTEVLSICSKAQRNLVLGLIYFAIVLFFSFPLSGIQAIRESLSVKYKFDLVVYLFGYIWQFLNLALIFSCYMWICKAGDEDMPMKEKKFFKKEIDKEE